MLPAAALRSYSRGAVATKLWGPEPSVARKCGYWQAPSAPIVPELLPWTGAKSLAVNGFDACKQKAG
jgi:hypothetical protein